MTVGALRRGTRRRDAVSARDGREVRNAEDGVPYEEQPKDRMRRGRRRNAGDGVPYESNVMSVSDAPRISVYARKGVDRFRHTGRGRNTARRPHGGLKQIAREGGV